MDQDRIDPAAVDVLAAVLAAQAGDDEGTDAVRTLRLPECCDRAVLVGSLREAVAALQERERQRERRGRLPANVGKPWTAEQDAALLTAFDAGLPLDTIASQLQRTRVGIRTRLERHGRLTPAPA
jgi:hypothetical protein